MGRSADEVRKPLLRFEPKALWLEMFELKPR